MFFRKTARKNGKVKRRTVKPKEKSRFLELAIVAIFALVMIYGASFAIRITHGFSKTIEMPEHTIRLQILNGCGVNGAASRVARALPGLISLPLEVDILEVEDFDSYNVAETFVISREKDLEAAEKFAEQLGLNTDKIAYNPIDNNYRSISLTLVLGDDFERLLKFSTE
ncbi:MAG: LytR C-terminal domain-containing protein [Candidatus Zixiibacteriota bacterium]|nr:MAG: LytR C-terminal domain-containing protein [candidate division Zixibacteria bacterium]